MLLIGVGRSMRPMSEKGVINIATLLALIFVHGIYTTGFVLVMDEQRVRLYRYV